MATDWSPAGDRILFEELRAETEMDLGVFRLADGTAAALLRTPAAELDGQFSPDGHWIAFVAGQGTSLPEVYVIGADETGGR